MKMITIHDCSTILKKLRSCFNRKSNGWRLSLRKYQVFLKLARVSHERGVALPFSCYNRSATSFRQAGPSLRHGWAGSSPALPAADEKDAFTTWFWKSPKILLLKIMKTGFKILTKSSANLASSSASSGIGCVGVRVCKCSTPFWLTTQYVISGGSSFYSVNNIDNINTPKTVSIIIYQTKTNLKTRAQPPASPSANLRHFRDSNFNAGQPRRQTLSQRRPVG